MNSSRWAATVIGGLTVLCMVLAWWKGGPLFVVIIGPLVFTVLIIATIIFLGLRSALSPREEAHPRD